MGKFLDYESRVKRWIEINPWKWSLVLVSMGVSLALFQSFLLESPLRITIITMMLYSSFLLSVEYFARGQEK